MFENRLLHAPENCGLLFILGAVVHLGSNKIVTAEGA
jgi:hypothetical protein